MTQGTAGEATVREQIDALQDDFTPAERQLQSVIMADYPFAALGPIQELSDRAHVSAPSISRFVNKLGYRGFHDFQRRLLNELRHGQVSPIELRGTDPEAQDDAISAHLRRAAALTQDLADRMPREQFDRICLMLGDRRRRVYMIGGRMSDCIAVFFLRHLRQIRPDVYHIPADPEDWPEYLLRLRMRDVVVIVDFRRYDPRLAELSAKVRTFRAQVVVITDPWITPAAKGATELVSVPIESGTLWDSYVAAFALVEAFLVHLADQDWATTRSRIEAWDALRMPPPEESKI